MKPNKKRTAECSPSASDCIIWTGPNIECINLCKGDSITSVTYKLALELCTIMDYLNITNYDIQCLNLTSCGPTDFKGLIQLIIDKLCEALGQTPNNPTLPSSGCPDCEVQIADCFYFDNELGDQITSLQLSEYTRAIGNKLCQLIEQLSTDGIVMENFQQRLQSIENTPPPANPIPQINTVCILSGSGPIDVHLVVQELESQFCEYKTALGDPVELLASIAQQCQNLSTESQLAGPGDMGDISGWKLSPTSVADTLNNIWLTICDTRAAIRNIQLTCCPTLCDSVVIGMDAVFTTSTNLKITFSGFVPAGTTECTPTSSFVIQDAVGNSTTLDASVIANLNNSTGVTLDLSTTGLNFNTDITITGTVCTTDGVSQCQKSLTKFVNNTNTCPTVTYTTTQTDVTYGFTYLTGGSSFLFELFDQTGTVLLDSNVHTLVSAGTVNGIFSGLTSNTQYQIKTTVTIGSITTNCPMTIVTTQAPACVPPSSVTSTIIE